ALHEIRKAQARAAPVIPKAPLQRVVRELSQKLADTTAFGSVTAAKPRWAAAAMEKLQTAAEEFLSARFQDAYALAVHAQRVTLRTEDMALAELLEARHTGQGG
ncbi:centromeric histone h3-like protein, cse4 like, partial [Geranomyces variabilis]